MRIIGYLHGLAAFREAVEEYQPENGVVIADLINIVRSHFAFQSYPILEPGVMAMDPIVFANGRYVKDEQRFAIMQLVMAQNGDVVAAVNTEHAELVLRELIHLLEEKLGYRWESADLTTRYVSNIVVEFDLELETHLHPLSGIIDIINHHKPAHRADYNLKRLGFSDNPSPATPQMPRDVLVNIEQADFLIERRIGQEFSRNRYFCSAPMATREHIQVLQEIEAVLREGANEILSGRPA